MNLSRRCESVSSDNGAESTWLAEANPSHGKRIFAGTLKYCNSICIADHKEFLGTSQSIEVTSAESKRGSFYSKWGCREIGPLCCLLAVDSGRSARLESHFNGFPRGKANRREGFVYFSITSPSLSIEPTFVISINNKQIGF